MTYRGAGFSVFFALLLFMALATGSSEIFLAVFLTGFVLAFALASAAAGVFALHINYSLTDKVLTRDDKATIKLFITGNIMLPVILRVNLVLPGDNQHMCAAQIFGYKKKVLTYEPVLIHRGVWKIGVKNLHCCDIFGFFAIPVLRSHFSGGLTSLTVYPVIYEIPGLPPRPTPTMDYNEDNPVTADYGDSFADTRLYRDGDPLKRIHWKISMRTHELHTRRYEMSVDRSVSIIVDTSALKDELPESVLNYADMAAESAAALALFFTSGGHTVSLYHSGGAETNINMITCSTGEFSPIYSCLATMEFGTHISFEETISRIMNNASSFNSIYVIARIPSLELIQILSGVSIHSSICIIYPDPTGYDAASQLVSNGIRMIAITRPQDIYERLGDMYE